MNNQTTYSAKTVKKHNTASVSFIPHRILFIFLYLLVSTAQLSAQSASALKFDGVDDYVALPDITSGFTTGQVSGEAWIYANSLPSWASIMKNWSESSQGMFHFGADAFSFILSIYIGQSDGNAVNVNSSIALEPGLWYHVAFSADGSLVHLYINGNEVGFAAYDGTLDTGVSATFLGAKPGDTGTSPATSLAGYWDGEMDEVRIWNRGLSQTEIQEHMNCELSGSQTGLIAYYKMNQATVNGDNTTEITAIDVSGNDNNAILTNFALTGSSSNWSSGVLGSDFFYADMDADGFGDAALSTPASCLSPAGYVRNALDCNDTNAAIYPGALEACNSLDDDCDGTVDESCSDTYTYYFDGDGDGYGKPYFPLTSSDTVAPFPYVALSGDCNDGNASVNPAATEVCNGTDDNCDGATDEGCAVMYTYYFDGDGDGYGKPYFPLTTSDTVAPFPYVALSGDCNDGNASVNPAATEICNGTDDNCEGTIDEGCGTSYTYYFDGDGDGYGKPYFPLTTSDTVAPFPYVAVSGDCNDGNASVNPAATEICNGTDDNCEGTIDEGCGTSYTYYFDGDGDGYGKPEYPLTTSDPFPPAYYYVAFSGDCNDGNSTTHPGATEVCDGIDNNCDGSIDESCVVMYTYYYDGDGDGYGSPVGILTFADPVAPMYYVSVGDDCNDGNPTMHPGATETCNYIDDDCNGTTDEGCGTLYTYYFDSDYDGYGSNDFQITIYDAFPPPAFALVGGDCENYNASINPGKTEVCNSIDDNCSGAVDEDCVPILLPDFTKSDINGATHNLYEVLSEGNAVVLEFSAGWCYPSQYTEPKISKVFDDICQGQGNVKLYDLVFETDDYGYASDDIFGAQYANRHNITYPVLTGTSDVFYNYAANYGNYNIPWFLVIIPDTAHPELSTVHQIIGDEPLLTDSIEHMLIAGGYSITSPDALIISVSGDVCDLPSPVTLTSSEASGNLWSTGDTTQSITVTGSGEYTLYHAADCGIITKKMYIDNLIAAGTLSLPTGNTACSGNVGVFQLAYDGDPATLQYSTDSISWSDFSLNFTGQSYYLNSWSTGTTVYFRARTANENSSVLGNCEVYSNVVHFQVEELEVLPHITVIDSACSFPITLQSFSPVNNMWSTGDTTASITATEPNYYYVFGEETCGLAFAIIYIWNADAMTWYADTDNDGYGDAENSIEGCSTPEGYTDNFQDCDDTESNVHPYATEVCNGLDDDCSGAVDDGGIIPLTGNITGSQKVCPGDISVIYTVEASENATSYKWFLDAGITSSTGSTITTTNTISLNFNSLFNGGTVSAQAMNDCGSGETSAAYSISKYTAKPSTPTAINGLTGIQYGFCGGSNYIFTTTSNANADSYHWTASAGTIIAGQGTNTVSIKMNAVYTSCKVTVTAENCLGITKTRNLTLKSAPAKAVVSGPSVICKDTDPVVSYNATSAGASTYTWSSATSSILFSDGGIPSNPLITSASNVSIDVAAVPAGVRKIKVTAANDCGNTKPFNKTITVSNCSKEGEINPPQQGMSFSLSPNPAQDVVNLVFDNRTDVSYVSVTNELGEILYEVTINGDQAELNCALLPSGMYIVHVTNNGGTAFSKLVIEK